MLANASSKILLACLLTRTEQGPTLVGTGNGTPEVPELPNAWGYSWATLSPGVINTERQNAGEDPQQIYCTESVQVTKSNDRPGLSSEGAPDIDKTVTATQ
jgi:hypothetical protein